MAAGIGPKLTAGERADVIDSTGWSIRADSLVNWCPGLGANEVTAGGPQRPRQACVRKRLRQWMMRITAMPIRLLDDLDVLDWPERRSRPCSAAGSEGVRCGGAVLGERPAMTG